MTRFLSEPSLPAELMSPTAFDRLPKPNELFHRGFGLARWRALLRSGLRTANSSRFNCSDKAKQIHQQRQLWTKIFAQLILSQPPRCRVQTQEERQKKETKKSTRTSQEHHHKSKRTNKQSLKIIK